MNLDVTKKVAAYLVFVAIFMISNCLISISSGMENINLDFRSKTFNVILEDESLKNVFEKIQKEKGIWFKAPENLLGEKMSVRFNNLSIQEGLKRILRTMNYSFIFDRENNLIGVFIIGKDDRIKKTGYFAELNEQMLTAAFEGLTTNVIELLVIGADINAKGKYSGWTPLMLAAKNGDIELVDFLLTHGADINDKSSVRYRNAIMEAVRNRKVETVKALLDANPDLNAVDWEGYTVLMFAAVSGQLDIVNTLITHGADVNIRNNVGSSALRMASGYPNVVKMLKEAGAVE